MVKRLPSSHSQTWSQFFIGLLRSRDVILFHKLFFILQEENKLAVLNKSEKDNLRAAVRVLITKERPAGHKCEDVQVMLEKHQLGHKLNSHFTAFRCQYISNGLSNILQALCCFKKLWMGSYGLWQGDQLKHILTDLLGLQDFWLTAIPALSRFVKICVSGEDSGTPALVTQPLLHGTPFPKNYMIAQSLSWVSRACWRHISFVSCPTVAERRALLSVHLHLWRNTSFS